MQTIKERIKIIKDLTSLTKKDTDQIQNLRHMLDNILNDTDQISIKDRLINYYSDLKKIHGDKVTKSMLETKCLENKIPARVVREAGGIKAIRAMVLDQSKNIDDFDQESESNTTSPSTEEVDVEVEVEEEASEEESLDEDEVEIEE